MKALYKMNINCGRMGSLEGLFLAYPAKVDKLLESGVEVYFGEVLGKHSEIYGKIEKKEIQLITEDEKVISVIEEFGLESGYNPFGYQVLNDDEDRSVDEYIDHLLNEGL